MASIKRAIGFVDLKKSRVGSASHLLIICALNGIQGQEPQLGNDLSSWTSSSKCELFGSSALTKNLVILNH